MRFPDFSTGSQWARFVPLAALAVYAGGCLFLWAEAAWRPEWDGALYLMVGRSLALGEGYRYLGEAFILRPPGLPWLVSLLFPDGSFDPALMNRVLMGFAATAVGAIWFSVRVQYGVWIALAVALLAGTNPIFVRMFNFVLSEFPFLTFLFLSFGCLQYADRRGPRWVLWALAGAIFLSAGFYVRAVTLLALPGVLLVGLQHDRGWQHWRGLLPLLAIAVLLLPWTIYAWNATLVAELPEDQLLAFDYSSITFRVDPGDPSSAWLSGAQWLERIANNGASLRRELTLATLFQTGAWAQAALGTLCLGGLAVALRRRASIHEWFAIAYAALVITYFSYSFRLIVPLLPFVYLYLLTAAAGLGAILARRVPGLRLRVALPGGLFALLLTLNLIPLRANLDPSLWGPPGVRLVESWIDIDRVAAWVEANTEANARLLVARAPMIAVLTGRTVYSYRFLDRLPPDPSPFERYRPDYVIFDNPTPDSRWLERATAREFEAVTRLDSAAYGPGALGVYVRSDLVQR